jgi:hypothetical protein
MSVPPATEMFQFTGFASCAYGFSTGYPCGWVAPFGDPGITDRSHLPRAFRSVPRPSSPLSAKASTRCPCFALDHRTAVTGDAHHRRAQGQTPKGQTPKGQTPCLPRTERGAAVSHEDTSLGHIPQQALLAHPNRRSSASPTGREALLPGPVRLGHITTLSSPFNQPRRNRLRRCRNLLRASGTPRARPPLIQQQRRSYLAGRLCRLVEVNGFEPMTSCLQSRRSPS